MGYLASLLLGFSIGFYWGKYGKIPPFINSFIGYVKAIWEKLKSK